MSENVAPAVTPSANVNDAPVANGHGAWRVNRPPNRNMAVQSSTHRDFEGVTPKLGSVLALRS